MNLGTFFVSSALIGLIAACGASGAGETSAPCQSGSSHSCECPNGATGTQLCSEGGAFETCTCAVAEPPLPPLAGGPDAAPTCGDSSCNGNETCASCARDCGVCPKCASAPSCTDAVGLPISPTLRSDLSQNQSKNPTDGGAPPLPPATECQDPKLRLRIEKILVHKGGGELYCVVSATDGATSEVAITQKTRNLGRGDAHFFDPSGALIWGQKDLHSTTNNLAITYNCFKVKSDSWAKVLAAMSSAASKVGVAAGPAGWVFGVGSVAANAAAAAVQAGAGDDLTLNGQQIIDKAGLTDLTNGRYWSVRRNDGGGLFGVGAWDWEIFVQSWGCADSKEIPR
jgi:hypothetical protein